MMFAGIFAAMAKAQEQERERKREEEGKSVGYVQWAQVDEGGAYSPAGKSVTVIPPGYYDIVIDNGQQFFMPIRARTDNLIRFPDSVSKKVLEGVEDFWNREKLFRKYDLPYKRGILLYGPPGSGKSCTLQLVAREIVERQGVVITYNPTCFLTCYRSFRDVQPDTQMVVLMEDFENILKSHESRLLNLLDGVEDLDKVLFLATTNYPERLEARIINRPSRFDQVVKVGHPSVESRIMYIDSLRKDGDDIDPEKYANDTKTMSLAHLKELFVSTVILGTDYDETLDRLKGMYMTKATSLNDDKFIDGEDGMFL